MQTAMSSWTSYSQAKIFYTYSGVRTGSLGGLTAPNGVNEVLFNDPNNEISGTFTGSGVVGTGGFNGVSGTAQWNAPFTADASHPAGAQTSFTISEGNLTIQDGVSPSTGISSSRLAEIVAHEFGHTLGLGHSNDNTALMYAYVTGLGPALRSDDQVAARWLYPNGSVAPPPPLNPPAAPSNLGASAAGSNVNLTWTDNANNETSQSVYMATGSGAFSKVGDVSADVVGATVSGFTAGTYRFYVTASNSAGSSTGSNIATATVSGGTQPQQLVAAFNVSTQSGTANVTNFLFTDQSTGGVSSWYSTFGDGSISQQQNPTKQYAASGSYSVTLTLARGTETASVSKTNVVTASSPTVPPVVAAFDAGNTSPIVGENVTFTDRSTGSPANWTWSFGDGATSTAQNPVHAYNAPGSYTVMLFAANAFTSGTASKTITVASIAPYRSLISAAAQQGGLGGTSWRTELSLFNAGTQSANVTALFIPSAGGSMVTRSIFLAPHQSTTYANTLLDLFGIANGAGAVAIEATSPSTAAQLRVTSRTFTNGSRGTYGQSVPDVRSNDLETTLYLTGIQSNAAFRTNIGLVNRGGSDVGATLTLYDSNGNNVSTAHDKIPVTSYQQSSHSQFFPETAGRSFNAMSMRMTTTAADVVTACASVIDNSSQDPVYMQAMPARSGSSMTIPAIGRANGANGTVWRSDLMVLNPSNDHILVSLRYAGTPKTLGLHAHEQYLVSDILTQFGFSSGNGPLAISWTGSVAPVVTNRTYTTDGSGGTFGQSIDPIAAFSNEMFVPGLRADVSYRSNVGVLNGGTDAEQLTVSLLSPAGFELGSTQIVLQPGELMQQSVTSLFPNLSSSIGSFTLQVRGDANAKLFAYGSMIDNASGDPVFFAGR